MPAPPIVANVHDIETFSGRTIPIPHSVRVVAIEEQRNHTRLPGLETRLQNLVGQFAVKGTPIGGITLVWMIAIVAVNAYAPVVHAVGIQDGAPLAGYSIQDLRQPEAAHPAEA